MVTGGSLKQRSQNALIVLCGLAAAACAPAFGQATPIRDQAHSSWREYGGSPDGAQYSSLSQVNRENVGQLHQVWSFSTGDARGYSFNPLVIGRDMYVLAHDNSIVKLDAATGKEIWTRPLHAKTLLITNRGLTYWQSKDGRDRRLILSVDNALRELNAETGEPIENFGDHGSVDLRDGLGRDPHSLTLVQSYNPGKIYGDLLILGSATNEEYASGPGDIRAYNLLTGKLAWIFHTIPHPGEPGYETWPKDAWKSVGGANAWSGMALDEKRGIIYLPTASPKYNFYGADRPGKNLYGDSLVALNARTGKLIWYYQMVHHDIWDYDNAGTPMLLTVRHDGRMVDVVAQASKVGFVWVFERETGKPLWPVEERPVGKSPMPGEETWPTQPFPTKPLPFARQSFTAKDLSPYLEPAERESLLKQMAAARNDGLFTPPSTTDTVEMPGNNGGANFGGSAIDPRRGYFYVVSKDLPSMLKLTLAKAPLQSGTPEIRGRSLFEANCSLCHGSDLKGKPPAIPALQDVHSRLSDDEIAKTIRSGRGSMPSFAHLGDADTSAILAYLKRPELAPAMAEQAQTAPALNQDPAQLHYRSGFGFMFAESGLPVIAPPWTTLTAYDLNTGDILWQRPLGEVPELAAQGHTDTGSHFPKIDPVVTAGGLIFTGSRDRKVRALDATTGKTLWEFEVGAALEGMPAVYEVGGREYVVFCAAARATTHTHALPDHPASQDPIPGAYVAFALP
ncbi:MAG: pyrroloquinoline quinone-dependent dehydrogenase [Edaphobacter sp.]|uniref:pyrroloquinoline quinone-dependent dehydrogenase n=1 Tax=Edaphobacter sp. TaxID=1934404 RepID=UPI00239AD590|nr:pyrroloquinoline quinone-dependent dehydrogenase [Edaphobacter sp.]MDE1175820.1 pyrroloquinoline quinone-dependent dehydrogenase [Edaphobacter sp.]